MTIQFNTALLAMMTLIDFCMGMINILITGELLKRRMYVTAFFSLAVGAAQLALLLAFLLSWFPALTLEQKFMAEFVSVIAGLVMFAITMFVLDVLAAG